MTQDAATPTIRADGWIPLPHCGCCGSGDSKRIRTVRGLGILRCGACGAVRAEAVQPPDALYQDGYHTGLGDLNYDYTDPHNVEYETSIAHRRLAILERFGPRGALLDIGGGVGTFAHTASERGWHATLVEPVPHAVEAARRMGVNAVMGGIEDLDPSAQRFDAASMNHVLEHLPEARCALERVRGLLRPGGLLFIEVPHHNSACRRSSGERWYGWRPGQHVYYFTKPPLRRLLLGSGFEVELIRSIVLTWDGHMLLHYSHILGLDPVLYGVARARRALRGRGVPAAGAPTTGSPGGAGGHAAVPPPMSAERGARRALLPLLNGLARAEERLGLGENLIAVARVPSR